MSNIIRRTIRTYLIETANTEPTYLRAREIVRNLDVSP